MKPLFITIEGVEGVGKSTNIQFIQSWLDQRGIRYLSTREPGGTDIGEKIRQLLLANDSEMVSPVTELMLMFAARAEHVAAVIKPALAEGRWVICDRFTDSSYAYQGGGRGLPGSTIAQAEALAIGNFEPDATLLLDLPVSEGLARAEQVGAKDRFESENADFFNRVRQSFLERSHGNGRFNIVDASKDIHAVQEDIANWLSRLTS